MRIVPEWVDLDNEIKRFEEKFYKANKEEEYVAATSSAAAAQAPSAPPTLPSNNDIL